MKANCKYLRTDDGCRWCELGETCSTCVKNYAVSVDITMSKTVHVEAKSEEEAMEIVKKLLRDNPYNYTNNFSHFVCYDVVDAEREEEE